MRPHLAILVVLLLVAGAPVQAQTTSRTASLESAWNPRGLTMDRSSLDSLRSRLVDVAESPAYSSQIRERARRDAEAIRERLTLGDFRTGDRIVLKVEGETDIPDTLVVESGPQITLPVMGTISLKGVLRSELTAYMTDQISRFIANPVVHARALIRLSIEGAVARPGFYYVPADFPIGDALMIAGGPSGSANLDKLSIQREGKTYLEGSELQGYMSEGRTLDQLNLHAGDRIVVPVAQPNSQWWKTPLRYTLIITSSLLLGVRIF